MRQGLRLRLQQVADGVQHPLRDAGVHGARGDPLLLPRPRLGLLSYVSDLFMPVLCQPRWPSYVIAPAQVR